VALQLDARKAIKTLGSEMNCAVGKSAAAILPPAVIAGVYHSHLEGLGAAAQLCFLTDQL
jgi:hypothetical protein